MLQSHIDNRQTINSFEFVSKIIFVENEARVSHFRAYMNLLMQKHPNFLQGKW
jgi:hypothetical protein